MPQVNHQDSTLVIGLGRFGTAVAATLDRLGREVLAVEHNPNTVRQWSGRIPLIEADATGPLTELAEIEGQVDVVVTNPPYVPAGLIEDSETASYDPPLALFGGGVDGLELPLKLIKRVSSLLRVGGVLVLARAGATGI